MRSITRFEWRPTGIYPWFRTIAIHIAIDHMRLHKKESLLAQDELMFAFDQNTPNATSNTDTVYIEAEEKRILQKRIDDILQQLNPRYAQAIQLRILQDLPREQVAERLGVTTATFDVILHRALSAFRKALGSLEPSSDSTIATSNHS